MNLLVRRRAPVLPVIFLAAAFPFAAAAVPLDQAACDKARQDQSALADVPRLMERGAAWAKTSATPDQLKRVARWIELEETLQFRCGQVRLTPGAEKAAAAAEALEAPPPAATDADGAKAPAAGPRPAAKSEDAAAEAQQKPKPKRKPKPSPAEQAATGGSEGAPPAAGEPAAAAPAAKPRRVPAKPAAAAPAEAPAAAEKP